jgi:thiamine biosynthesis protein ThiS
LAGFGAVRSEQEVGTTPLQITLNGERFELEQPLSISALLEKLAIDPRRVAVEHNLAILKRQRYPEVVVGEGDRIEIVNFVGGG